MCGGGKQYNALLVVFDKKKTVNAVELGISIDFIFQGIFVIIFIIVQGKKKQDTFEPERKHSYLTVTAMT